MISDPNIETELKESKSNSEKSAEQSAENLSSFGSLGGPSLESIAIPLSLISGAAAVPLLSALVNLKFTEKLAFVNIEYGPNLNAFF